MSKNKKRRVNIEIFDIADISPLTNKQKDAFDSNKNLILCGSAGCGKSFLASFFAVTDLSKGRYKNIVLIRSAVPSRDMGFLPGNDQEKARIYEEPYYGIFSEILGRGDAYTIMKQKNVLDFMTTSYLRGITINDSVIIVDECQNALFSELNTIMTRVGNNCKVIFCGDFKQTDLKLNGMRDFLNVVDKMPEDFDIIEFGPEDIVRSDLVRRYIVACERLQKEKSNAQSCSVK